MELAPEPTLPVRAFFFDRREHVFTKRVLPATWRDGIAADSGAGRGGAGPSNL